MALPAKKIIPPSFPQKEIEQTIRDWWRSEEEAVRQLGDPFKELRPGTVFDILPLIPSQQAVEVVVLLEPLLGREISESVIKRGGYYSVDEFVADIMPRLQKLFTSR